MRARPKSGATIASTPSPSVKPKSPSSKLTAILPLLMLCVVSCSTVSQPSIQPAQGAPAANAFRLQLPAGTKIAPVDDRSRRELEAIAHNELEPQLVRAREVELAKPLQLVSPAYIAQRNATEMHLLKMISELKEENARLRASR